MYLSRINVQNYRSIVDSGDIRIERLQAFVGENNSGKSNLLRSIDVFLSGGTGGITIDDFNDDSEPIRIKLVFSDLTRYERMNLRRYLLGDELILEKRIELDAADTSAKPKFTAEYHGYRATPKEWWLSTDGVIAHEDTSRPDWRSIAEEHGILEYVQLDDGRVLKSSYESGLSRLLVEREDIEFEEPELGDTQALGYQSVLLKALPGYRLLPAITDYSDEIDRRSSSTNFRLLMGDLADRILIHDPRYAEIEQSLKHLEDLLNSDLDGDSTERVFDRLPMMGDVESQLSALVAQIMPSVSSVNIRVDFDPPRDLFSRGVSILVDDGKMTEVLLKGHGLQRCLVFSLLRALIMNQRGQLVALPEGQAINELDNDQRIILAIEEPELYIHPQMERLIFSVLKDFSQTDQVIYSTHSPAYIDVGRYESIVLVRKLNTELGTQICQCEPGILDAASERKTFQFISSFGIDQNMMLFARKVILVEGKQDTIAILSAARHLGIIREYPEEVGVSIVETQSKQEMPKFMKLLNAFEIPFVVLHELDGDADSESNLMIRGALDGNRLVELEHNLEVAVGHEGHFGNNYNAMRYFEDSANLTEVLLNATRDLFA